MARSRGRTKWERRARKKAVLFDLRYCCIRCRRVEKGRSHVIQKRSRLGSIRKLFRRRRQEKVGMLFGGS